jgi:tetratricopeptide (TPR) repeat protein
VLVSFATSRRLKDVEARPSISHVCRSPESHQELDLLGAEARDAVSRGELSSHTLRLLDELVERCPREIAWRNMRGRCLVALERYEDAQASFEQALQLQPGQQVARSQLDKLRRRHNARAAAERLLAESPETLFDRVEMAKNSESQLDFQVEGRRLLAQRDSRNPATVCALGAAQRRAGDPHGALNTYREALRLDGDVRTNPMGHIGLAAVLRNLKRLADARGIYHSVLDAHPQHEHALLGLAAVRMDDHEQRADPEALSDAKRLLDRLWASGRQSPPVRAAYNRLARLSA